MTYGGNLMLEAQMRGGGEQISAGGRGRDRQETGGGTQVDPSRASSLTPHTHWRGTTLVSWRGRARSPLPPLLLRRGENEVKSSEPFFVRLLRTPRGRSAAGPPRRSVRVRPSVSRGSSLKVLRISEGGRNARRRSNVLSCAAAAAAAETINESRQRRRRRPCPPPSSPPFATDSSLRLR